MRTALLLFIAALPLCAGLKTDIEFAVAGEEHLTLDAYVPDGAGPFATVIIVHGGIKKFYGMEPEEDVPATLDHMVAAIAG